MILSRAGYCENEGSRLNVVVALFFHSIENVKLCLKNGGWFVFLNCLLIFP